MYCDVLACTVMYQHVPDGTQWYMTVRNRTQWYITVHHRTWLYISVHVTEGFHTPISVHKCMINDAGAMLAWMFLLQLYTDHHHQQLVLSTVDVNSCVKIYHIDPSIHRYADTCIHPYIYTPTHRYIHTQSIQTLIHTCI